MNPKRRVRLLPVKIVSHYRLEEMLAAGERRPSHCISIADPGDPRPQGLGAGFSRVLKLSFHDIDRSSDMPRSERPRTPSRRDIAAIVRFARRTSGLADGYLVHCHAGVHRSVAAGLILLYLMTGDEAKAGEALLRAKAMPLPNRRMIALFDAMYGSRLASVSEPLWARLGDFLAGRLQIDQDDYLDELEPIEG